MVPILPPFLNRGIFGYFFVLFFIQHCFICRPLDSTVSEDAGIELRTVANFATLALAVRRSHSARPHPQPFLVTIIKNNRYIKSRVDEVSSPFIWIYAFTLFLKCLSMKNYWVNLSLGKIKIQKQKIITLKNYWA